jgi:hypothetical protein
VAPTATEGSDDVVIDKALGAMDEAGVTTTEVVAEVTWAGLLLSVTVAVKVEVPLVVGEPEIVPVEGLRVNPAGRFPDVIDQV